MLFADQIMKKINGVIYDSEHVLHVHFINFKMAHECKIVYLCAYGLFNKVDIHTICSYIFNKT